jgi:hypothetical protein
MHVGSKYKLRNNTEASPVTVEEISLGSYATMVQFSVEDDGSTGEIDIHTFREMFVAHGVTED